jgi:serine/threonine protein kinase/formylglycine-generating enzyme required for sulfatase activity
MPERDETVQFQPEGTQRSPSLAVPAQPTGRIGRYQVKKTLGEGHYGRVYLALDTELEREVAIKVPHRARVPGAEDTVAYLSEARSLANLDHPHIVPVFDVGTNEEWPCFIVSKYIHGSDLATMIRERRPLLRESIELVAALAEALHYAHRKGLVHRDVKPGNILVDDRHQPYLADFGLALREEDFGTGPNWAGTPAYMSPEQARYEGHRVDGRADIFSLGVVFYELLSGRHPFRGGSQREVIDRITAVEPRPLRQIDEDIPKEVERICFRALAKRASERYMTAKDMADDLRHFLAQETVVPGGQSVSSPPAGLAMPLPSPLTSSGPLSVVRGTQKSYSQLLKIVPKGLRSYDVHDADFFLELLPGPRDRDGLPDSIRFWKTLVEETDPDHTFPVGLIYGPSGCGKSSLVKAGLLPRLAKHVVPVYIEATAKETETRLLYALSKVNAAAPVDAPPPETGSRSAGLQETLAAIRLGKGIPAGKKILLVIDQFEQWLHASRAERNTELVQALRQCNGGQLQCVLLVRDDFWLAVSRFFTELEIDLRQGQNTAPADLFDLDHAGNVLAAFGRAFERLPENPREMSKEQREFLKSAVSDLAQDGKVICVRLALFAEMMKGRPWTPATLKAVGGTEGLGVTFLEENFSSASANPMHRLHQKAARAVLKSFLPEPGTNIKGHMCSYAALLEASGYDTRLRDFDDLIRILDSETRLITPAEAQEAGGDGFGLCPLPRTAGPSRITPGDSAGATNQARLARYYQLTHDYLVPPLREWLTRKQKETRRGRAELALADRASIWHVRPENRQLPPLREWLAIRLLTRSEKWTEPERKMMRRATRYHALRGAALLAVVGLAALISLFSWTLISERKQADHAEHLVRRLLVATIAQAPDVISEIEGYRHWADPLLKKWNEEARAGSPEKLRLSLALLPVDPAQADYLCEHLLSHTKKNPEVVPILRNALFSERKALTERLWAAVEQPGRTEEGRRLRAAALLALYDPDSPRWQKYSDAVTEDLVSENWKNWSIFGLWLEAFRPVRGHLLPPLSKVFRDRRKERSAVERTSATNILVEYAADQPEVLADLLMDADEEQFALLFPKLREHGESARILLERELGKDITPSNADAKAKDGLAQRQANAAVALLKMGGADRVWPLLKHHPDPSVRSYLIHRLGPLEADPLTLIHRVALEKNLEIRRALFLSLGEFGDRQLLDSTRKEILPRLLEEYAKNEDPGIHGAVEWLLRKWDQRPKLEQMNREWSKDQRWRDQKLLSIEQELKSEKEKAKRRWYVNGQGQTMVVLPGPVDFSMGSPSTEVGRARNEQLHLHHISRTFAVATKAVTLEQFLLFLKDFEYEQRFAPDFDCPVGGTTWYLAAAYCNWLSEQELIPKQEWCFEPIVPGKYDHGMRLAPDYLKRRGYRLPTEAEWEYACRAGSVTSRYYGETDVLLPKYGWCLNNADNHSHPVGMLKPNDWGLFDMHGNTWTWCLERFQKDYPIERGGKPVETFDEVLVVSDKDSRPNRGGSFGAHASDVRSASRGDLLPTVDIKSVGLRPVRTFR